MLYNEFVKIYFHKISFKSIICEIQDVAIDETRPNRLSSCSLLKIFLDYNLIFCHCAFVNTYIN